MEPITLNASQTDKLAEARRAVEEWDRTGSEESKERAKSLMWRFFRSLT